MRMYSFSLATMNFTVEVRVQHRFWHLASSLPALLKKSPRLFVSIRHQRAPKLFLLLMSLFCASAYFG